MLGHLALAEDDTDFCRLCHLPLPNGKYEAYEFCPWCCQSINGLVPRIDEARRIIEHQWQVQDEIQCGECGGEYEQPNQYPFRFCPHCGAQFASKDEIVIELPFLL